MIRKLVDALNGDGRSSLAELDAAMNAHRELTDRMAKHLLDEELSAVSRIRAAAAARREAAVEDAPAPVSPPMTADRLARRVARGM